MGRSGFCRVHGFLPLILLSVVLVACFVTCADTADGLSAHYTFDDSSPNLVLHYSFDTHDGVIVPNAGWHQLWVNHNGTHDRTKWVQGTTVHTFASGSGMANTTGG